MNTKNATSFRYIITLNRIGFIGKKKAFLQFLRELRTYDATQVEFCRTASKRPEALRELRRP